MIPTYVGGLKSTTGCCNIHKKFIQALIKVSKADVALNLIDKMIRPLPNWAQSVFSTLFISIVPIFLIYLVNITFLNG